MLMISFLILWSITVILATLMGKSKAFFLVLISIIFVFTGCGDNNKTKARGYDRKVFFVKEGILSVRQSEAEKITNSRVFRVDASFGNESKKLYGKDYVFLGSVCENRPEATIEPDVFLKLIESNDLREANKDEIANAELCEKLKGNFENKKGESIVVKSIRIKGHTISIGDDADYVFGFFSNDMEDEKPLVASDPETGEVFFVTHTYLVEGIQYRLRFKRKCYSCRYILNSIDKYPYHSLTFEKFFHGLSQ